MVDKCSIPDNDVKRMKAYPNYAKDTVTTGIYSQKQVDDCVTGGQPSKFEQLKGMLADAFGKATSGVEHTVRAGAELAADGVANNSGMTGQAADALRNRGAQLKAQEMAAGI